MGPRRILAIVGPGDGAALDDIAAAERVAELLRRIFEVDPLACPWCRGLMRIVAVITDPGLITRILAHRARAREDAPDSRSPPSRRRRARSPAPAAPSQS